MTYKYNFFFFSCRVCACVCLVRRAAADLVGGRVRSSHSQFVIFRYTIESAGDSLILCVCWRSVYVDGLRSAPKYSSSNGFSF